MATYAYLNILLMERTATIVAPVAGMTQIDIPVITVDGRDIRPRGFAFVSTTGDFNFATGVPSDLGDEYDVAAAELSSAAQIVRALGPTDELWLSGDGADEDVVVRWFWAHGAKDGYDIAAPYGVTIPTRSFDMTQVQAGGEQVVNFPVSAMELVIEDIDANTLRYRVDDGTADGGTIDINAGEPTFANPYRIYFNETDRVRFEAIGGNCQIRGYVRWTGG